MTTKHDPRQTCIDLASWMEMYGMAHPELGFTNFIAAFFNVIINVAGRGEDKEEALGVLDLCVEQFKGMIESYKNGDCE